MLEMTDAEMLRDTLTTKPADDENESSRAASAGCTKSGRPPNSTKQKRPRKKRRIPEASTYIVVCICM